MVTQSKRDYRLSGRTSDAPVALDDEQIEDRVEANWWHPSIARKDLKALMERRDGPALWHFGLWIALLLVSGYAAILSWGTWWAVPAFLIYGTIYFEWVHEQEVTWYSERSGEKLSQSSCRGYKPCD